MHLIQRHAPDQADVNWLIREVIAVVCRRFDPARGDLWRFLPPTIYRVEHNPRRRAQEKEERAEPLPEDGEVVDPTAIDFAERLNGRLDAEELQAALRAEWRKLSPAEGYLLFLRYWAKMSIKEVADLSASLDPGRTVPAVSYRSKCAIRKLRRVLAPFAPRGACGKAGQPIPAGGRSGRRPHGAQRRKV